MSGQSLQTELNAVMVSLDSEIIELKRRGVENARAESDYYAAKASAALRMKAEGVPATIIGISIKGDRAVNDKLYQHLKAQALYDASRECINRDKLKARILDRQMQQEWGRS